MPNKSHNRRHGESTTIQLQCVTHNYQDQAIQHIWRGRLAQSDSASRIYQSPEYFEYLMATAKSPNIPHLYMASKADNAEVLGMVLVWRRDQTFEYRAGNKVFAKQTIPILTLLGGTMLIPTGSSYLGQVIDALLTDFPECKAVALPTLPLNCYPRESIQWSNTAASPHIFYVEHGWRKCHTIPLPSNFVEYEKQFGGKKRYNLKRQIRLLKAIKGGITLHRIEEPSQIPLLMEALKVLDPAKQYLSAHQFAKLAELGLLLCFVAEHGGQIVGVQLGSRYERTYYVHNTVHDRELDQVSAGTSILHMVIRDLIEQCNIDLVDMGYGSPAHSHSSTNIVVHRGQVLLMRKTLRNYLLANTHQAWGKCIAYAKEVRHRLNSNGKTSADLRKQ
jgi:hypothetical protein